jgi:hypothetical protein
MSLRPVATLLFLLACATPSLAGDLSGLWEVEGTLPDGTSYRGHAALSAAGGDYFVLGRARLDSGRRFSWRADAERSGNAFTVTHRGSRGLAGKIAPGLSGSKPRVIGSYTVSGDEGAFGGDFLLEGTTSKGSATYTKHKTPKITSKPSHVQLALGEQTILRVVVDPPEAASLLWGEGSVVRRHRTRSGGVREILVEGKVGGTHSVQVRLGPSGGAFLAEIKVQVGPGVVAEVLQNAEALAAAGETPVVIFDLDDTLFDTRYRVRRILRDYGKQIGNDLLKRLSVSHVRYELPKTLANAGFTKDEIEGSLGKSIKRAWSRKFFHGDSFHFDGRIRGARAYVEKLVKAGAKIVYVTGRRETYRAQSLKVLADAGFPAETIFLKPVTQAGQPKISTHEFKEATAKGPVAAMGRVVAAFDNEPENCNAFRRALPQDGRVIWLDTLYKPTSKITEPAIDVIRDFR